MVWKVYSILSQVALLIQVILQLACAGCFLPFWYSACDKYGYLAGGFAGPD